jgi:hypothetical protein
MANNRIQNNLTVLISSSFVICLIFIFTPLAIQDFDPIPWLTLIISGTFGLLITIIVNTRSQKLLDFLADSEEEKRSTALRTIKNNINSINELSKLYFEAVEKIGITSDEKRRSFKAILPTLKESLKLCQNASPLLGKLVVTSKLETLEKHFDLLNDLFLILEHGSDNQFDNNVGNFKEYSKNIAVFLDKII